MGRVFGVLFVAVLAAAIGVGATLWLLKGRRLLPDPPSLVTQVREVARLETLEVNLYKKVSLVPDPPAADSLWGDVFNWAKFTIRDPHGKAIVFATAHLGLDLQALSEDDFRVVGPDIELRLPPLKVTVELHPGETEVVGSNLSSAETAELFEKAKKAFEADVRSDPKLAERARSSGERQIRALLITLGFRSVRFVDRLSAPNPG